MPALDDDRDAQRTALVRLVRLLATPE
jgi:hypothetical protein